MELAADPDYQGEALAACLDLCVEGSLTRDDLEPHASTILDSWRAVFEQVKPMQQSALKLDWMLDEDYSGLRNRAGILLDLMGYLPMEVAENPLREAFSLTDPRLKFFAALSLLRNLRPVEPAELESIAASHEIRILLWEELRKMQMESLMPSRWSTPEMLAASEFSRWVSHPMELGAPPEEIEPMGTFAVSTSTGRADVYLFRFREYPKPWEDGAGWMAGIAGPIRDGEFTGSSWSSFDRWNSMAPEEHFAKLHRISSRC